jgi:uncharacterized protein
MEQARRHLTEQQLAGLVSFCRSHGIRVLRLFGSVLTSDFSEGSDIDILVEFAPGVDPDLLELGGMQQDLSDLFGREVDLKTPDMFAPAALERVLARSVTQYAA